MAQVRVKTVKRTLANKDVQRLFSSAVCGDSDSIDVKVAWPKFKRIRRHTKRTIALIRWLSQCEWLRQAFPAEMDIVGQYAAELALEYQTHFVSGMPDLDAPGLTTPMARELFGSDQDPEAQDAFVLGIESADADSVLAFKSRYGAAIKSDLVATAVATCSNLTAHKASLENYDQLRGHFLLGAGLNFAPIPQLPAANFKAFYLHALSLDASRAKAGELLIFLHRLYTITHLVYDAANAPDVDAEEFVSIITQSIAQVKNQPGLERCGAAFKKLEESVDLLRNNFGTYYKDSMQSGNASMMMENFVMDVAGNSKDSPPHVRMQFKKIIQFYKKLAASQPKDATTQALFGEIETNFAELERRSREAGIPDGDEPEADAAGAADDDEIEGGGAPPTAAAAAAQAEARDMTEAERLSHKAELKKRCKKRAAARRNASKSMDKYLDHHATESGLSELARELLARRGAAAPAAADAVVADAAAADAAAADAAPMTGGAGEPVAAVAASEPPAAAEDEPADGDEPAGDDEPGDESEGGSEDESASEAEDTSSAGSSFEELSGVEEPDDA